MRLKPDNPKAVEGITIHRKMVKDLDTYNSDIFKLAAKNRKLGNGNSTITKGRLRGMPMYSLTLTERETCPRSCHHWLDCYGNGMAYAHRFPAGPKLEERIRSEIAILAKKHKRGFLVRLHVLGDFYSKEYVQLWYDLLREHSNLSIFGYTARHPISDPIGVFIRTTIAVWGNRFAIRLSQSVKDSTLTMAQAIENPSNDSITCPQQTGKTEACITCGLCWATQKPIHFLNH